MKKKNSKTEQPYFFVSGKSPAIGKCGFCAFH